GPLSAAPEPRCAMRSKSGRNGKASGPTTGHGRQRSRTATAATAGDKKQREQGFGPAQFFPAEAPAGSLHHSEDPGEAIERHEPIAVSHGAQSKDQARGNGRPGKLAPDFGNCRRPRIGSGSHGSAFGLAAHAPRQHREKHGP